MKVLYSVEINNKCPPYIDYIKEMENGSWSMEQDNVELAKKDQVMVSVLVEYRNEIYKATERITLGEMGEQDEQQTETNTIKYDAEIIDDKVLCKDTETTSPGTVEKICQGDQIFGENFDLREEPLRNWSHDIRIRLNSLRTEEFVVFNDEEKNNFIRQGILNIVPTITETDNIRVGELNLITKCTAVINPLNDCYRLANQHLLVLPPIQSSQIHTRQVFKFKYGRVEIRAKLPKGDWILPYIVLQPSSIPIDLDRAPQIRVAFARGNSHLLDENRQEIGGSRLYSGIVYEENGNYQPLMVNFTNNKHFGDDFHVYSMNWTETGLSFGVDGINYGEITTHLDGFQEEFFLILGVSVGGHIQFPDDSPTPKPWTNTSPKAALDFWKKRNSWIYTWNGNEGLQVDYIRVYAI